MRKTQFIVLTGSLLLAYACKDVKSSENSNAAQEQNQEMKEQTEVATLTSQLEARKTDFNSKADENIKRIFKDGLDAVAESGVVESAKNVGDMAPEFTLKNALGNDVSLKEYLAKGPVVLIWYRGGWCPYCNLTLHAMQEELPNFTAAGASLIALTPELPDQSISTAEKHELEFEVLSDVGNKVAREYGVVFKLIDDVAKIYNEKFDLNGYNGDDSNELPLAATYIINTDGKIEYAFLDADYRKRAEPSEITEFIKTMKE